MSDDRYRLTPNTLDVMKNIIDGLRRNELQNAGLAIRLSEEQIQTASRLNQNIGNVAELAQNAQELAGTLRQFADAENNAAVQLGKLAEIVASLGNT